MMRLRDNPMFCVSCINDLKESDASEHVTVAESAPKIASLPISKTNDAERSQQTTKAPVMERTESSHQATLSVYSRLISELESQLDDRLPLPHNTEFLDVSLQRIERILNLISLAKSLMSS